MPLYFAYGSNLLHQRLQRRCAAAHAIGRAEAQGWVVDFTKYSWMDGSGKATIRASAKGTTEGVLYELPKADLATLDRIEGVGKGYDRLDKVPVQMVDGSAVDAITYIASEPRDGQRPFDWYLGLILAGCRQNGLTAETITAFRAHPWDPDPMPDRPGCAEARAILTAHCGPDWRRDLLGAADQPSLT